MLPNADFERTTIMTNPVIHQPLKPADRFEYLIAEAFQAATITLAGVLALLTVAATV